MPTRLALLIPLFIAMPVNADTVKSIEISYADLNLASAKGQAVLERRIESAVKKVCDSGQNSGLAYLAASQKCQKAARAAASSKMQVAIRRAASAQELATANAAPKS